MVMTGQSENVGKPAAFVLMAEGATVTVCHQTTRSVAMRSRRAHAVVVAVGKPHFLSPDMTRPGAAAIDIGINQIMDSAGVTRIVGDADPEAVKAVAGWITPVPGGVGPVTVAIPMRNALAAQGRQRQARRLGKRPRATTGRRGRVERRKGGTGGRKDDRHRKWRDRTARPGRGIQWSGGDPVRGREPADTPPARARPRPCQGGAVRLPQRIHGGRRYHEEKHGHMVVHLPQIHVPITPRDAEDWLACMDRTLASKHLEGPEIDRLRVTFRRICLLPLNRPAA